jgi:hypothetical protein
MMQYRLRTLLIRVVVTWIATLVGAVCGALAANQNLGNNLALSFESARFAIYWGVAFGLIPAGASAALTTEYASDATTFGRWWLVAWSVMGIGSGITLYYFATFAANI